MLDHGGVPKERVLVYDCNQHPPADPEPHITINSFATLEEALVQLRTAIGKVVVLIDDIYYGPTKANSYFLGYHC
ncbi:unnamed protein product [Brassica oleracea var. botrytis]